MSEDNEIKNDSSDTSHDSGTDTSHHDRGDSGRSESLRENIRAAWKEQTGEEPEDSRRDRDEERQRERRAEPRGRAAREAKQATDAQQRDKQASAGDSAAQPRSAAFGPDGAPTAWAASAKQRWSELPKEVQAAVTKREEDVARGVGELRQRYADMEQNFSQLDQALAPHRDVIRSFGHSDAQAVAQMFGWFDALSKRPDQSFPVLLKSFNYDPRRLVQLMGLGGGQQQHAQQSQAQQYDPALLNYLNTVEQRLGGMDARHQEQMMAQTQQVLADFAKDKPHFERVRRQMGLLLQPDAHGNAIIPLTPEGHVNLLAAYEMAVRMDHELNNQMFAERQAAERQAANDAAARARRSSASLIPSAPGRGGVPSGAKQKQRQSVRDSIEAAIKENSGSGRF